MRIRFLTSTPLNIARGSGTYIGIQTLARALHDLGVDVDLVTPRIHLPVYTLERIVYNETLRFRGGPAPDLTVGFDMDGYAVAGRGLAPHMASLKGVIADELRFQKGFTRATMAVQAGLEARHVRRADFVVTTSQYAAARIRELYGVEVMGTVPELIDLRTWRRLLEQNPAERRDRFIVLCVCRLYRRKRLGLLLRAAARLRDRIPDLEVRIVGDGPEREEFLQVWREERLGDAVRWLGDVSRSRLAREYNGCDLFCLPSVQEGFGIVFLEAMAAGKPIAAARAAAVPEVLPQGVLVEPENADALAGAIESLYRDPAEAARLAALGRERVRQFDAPRVARLFLDQAEVAARARG